MSQARCASTGCAWSAIAHNSDRLRDRRVGSGASAVLGPPSERAACRRRTRIEQSLASLKYARAIAPRHEKHEANISLALIRPAAPRIRSCVHGSVGQRPCCAMARCTAGRCFIAKVWALSFG